jgi:hypothetical protein
LKNIISILVFILVVISSANAQSFTYSYTDPCTGIRKNIAVASSGVTVSYYGQVTTFTPSDFYSGAFEAWTNNVYNSFGGINPCASVVGMPTATSVAQSTAINFVGQVNSLSALADLSSNLGAVGSTDILGGATGSASNSSVGGDNNGNSNNTSDGNNSNSSTTTSNDNTSNSSNSNGKDQSNEDQGSSSKTDEGTNGSNKSEGSTTEGGSDVGSNNNETGTGSSSEGGGKTNILGGSVNSVGGSSGGSSNGGSKGASSTAKNGNRPSILASSDFVGFNFKNADVSFGGKVTGGYTAMRWDGKRANGITADYTSALRGPNITGFYANITKKRIDLISGTFTIGFDRQMSAYGTIALGQMWNLGKKKKAKAVYMITGSWGRVYGSSFIGTAVITGGMYDLNVGKRTSIKLMGLYVYAPYVSYYNDILLKSPHVVLPIVGTNVSVTKKFKININGGGAWAIGESTLNYTIMMGTRLLL